MRGRLKNVSQKFYGAREFKIDFKKLVSGFTKVFYYDALPVREQNETEDAYAQRIKPQKDLLDAASGVDRIHVYEGDARRRRKAGLEQKKVDVMIAVDMLTHTFRRNMHQATLLTGDNDFKPLVDALVHEGMFVTLWYPPDETSKELLDSADARRPLGLLQLQELLINSDQREFGIPMRVNKHPNDEPGTRIREWMIDGKRHALNQEDDDYIVLVEGDPSNRLNIRHKNMALLRTFYRETYGVDIPQEESGSLPAGAD